MWSGRLFRLRCGNSSASESELIRKSERWATNWCRPTSPQNPGGQATLAATADSFAATALVTNAAGNFLGFGVVVPLYAWPSLPRALPRWIGWLGLLVGALAGWLGLLSPASSVIASISNIGFIGFFVSC